MEISNLNLSITNLSLILSGLFLVLVMHIGRRLYFRKKYNINKWERYVVEDGDNISYLAKIHNVDKKIIIKVNKLKAPFKLKVGGAILIPPVKKNINKESSLTGAEGGNSIAETLWKDFEKDEIIADIDSLTKKKADEKVKKESKNKIISKIETEKNIRDASVNEDIVSDLEKNKSARSWTRVLVNMIALAVIISGAFVAGRISVEKKVVVEKKTETPVEPIVEQDTSEEMQGESINLATDDDDSNLPPEDTIKEVNLSVVNVLVLNGGVTVGAAGDMKDVIMKADELVEDVVAANAVGDYPNKTVIYYQEDFKVAASKIGDILKEQYGQLEIMTMNDFPKEEKKSDVVVIIGEK